MADSADMWLSKMQKAIHSLNYTGTYVYLHRGQIETMQIIHAVDGEGEKERLLSLNGEAREILRDSNSVTCILPADRSIVVGKLKAGSGLPTLLPENILQLGEVYEIQLIGKDRIAAYPALILSIQPKDKMRYGYRIWLEEVSGMLLRSDMIDPQGQVMEQMMFTEINLQSPVSLAMLKPTVPHDGFVKIESASHAANEVPMKTAWRFHEMPKGFKVTSQTRKTMPMKKHKVEHIVLSDGLATISVYIEKSDVENTLQGASSMGGVNAYGLAKDGYQVTVMGEAPKETIKHIADSLAYTH